MNHHTQPPHPSPRPRRSLSWWLGAAIGLVYGWAAAILLALLVVGLVVALIHLAG